jgi:hypothetical protein
MSNSDIESYINNLDLEIKTIKDDIFRISWFMRGGVTSYELFNVYSKEDRDIIDKIIKDNLDLTKKTGMNFL